MRLCFLFLVTTFVWSLGASMFAPNSGRQAPALRAEGLSPLPLNKGVSIQVLWRVSGYKVGEGALWGEEEARKMLFKPLDIDATKIVFDGQTCHNIFFKRQKTDMKEYLDRVYRITPQVLGLEDGEAEVEKTNCDLPGFAEYIRLRDRRLIIHLNGVFFYFEPVANY